MRFWACLLGSFFIVAFGQPFWISPLGVFSGAIGFALFWKAMFYFPERKKRFWLAVFWFAFIQAVVLSWMTSTEYMGLLILIVYAFLIFAMGLQFGLLSLLLNPKPSFSRCLALSGCWVLLEWSRLFFLTGFPWNPVGLALANSSYSIQLASLIGIYGLSFWVIWVNLAAWNALWSKRWRIGWAVCAVFPYLFGLIQKTAVENLYPAKKTVSVALVQTALLPEQKEWTRDREQFFIPPLTQWERILQFFQQKEEPIDLIVFPEAALPFGAYRPLYPFQYVQTIWKIYFGDDAALPPLQEPMAVSFRRQEHVFWKVSNAYLAQALANQFQAHVIAGLDDREKEIMCNAAFHFHPQGHPPERYEKRILMPVVEYIPWAFLSEFFAKQYGIEGSFFPGKEEKVFSALCPIGISICAEEIYSDLIRQIRLKGAEFLVSISNDVWFPRSRLALHHFQHGRLRAVENGTYLFRSCNTGVTGVVDCFGNPLAVLEPSEKIPAVLFTSVPIRSFPTLYTLLGDRVVVGLSALFFFSVFSVSSVVKKLARNAIFWRKKLP